MIVAPQPQHLADFWSNGFELKAHLQEFLKLESCDIDLKLTECRETIKAIGEHFDWAMVDHFYQEQVGSSHIFELAAWHLESSDYIGDMLCLINDQAVGRVLDFGGGIGTHAIGAALCPNVTEVHYADLNPTNCEFVRYRAAQLGLSDKLHVSTDIPDPKVFDTILCFDVVEHLPDPAGQLQEFYEWLKPSGVLLVNWYFSKGFNQEFPFHLDDPAQIDAFFTVLQRQFLEQFHPYLMTTRSYRKVL
jgi:SAM-dependent methyltransferase